VGMDGLDEVVAGPGVYKVLQPRHSGETSEEMNAVYTHVRRHIAV